MSTQDALAFFRTVRQRADLQERLTAPGPAITTEQLIALASELGSPCSPDDLQAAFRHDWVMRWLYHRHDASGPGPS